MPYSGAGDDSLPAYVKKLSAKDKRQWVAVFNSAYEKCTGEGGDGKTCESSAFAQANGVVKGGKRMDIAELWEQIKRLFEPLVERIKDVSSWDGSASRYPSTEAYCKACLINENTGAPADWKQALCKLPVKDTDGQPVRQAIHAAAAALAGARGGVQASPEAKKKAANQIISYYNQMDEQAPDSVYKAAGKSPPARTTEYLPMQTRAFIVTRQDGIPRWLMIAASAVVNKVNAIDSTTLFDNFIRHAQESGEYPALDFLHQEDAVRFGAADWLARDGALYLASGTFDDTELARAAAQGLETDPAYWGASISYHITEPPLMLLGEGQIPVYTDGVNNFISIVPRRMAASLFTAATIAQEVNRMDKRTFDELVRLVGPAAAQQFAEQVDDANRTITDTGMVTRAEPEAAPVEPVPAETAPVEPETRIEPETPAETAQAETVNPLDSVMARLAELEAKLAKLEGGYAEASTRTTEEQKRASTALDDLTQRLAGVEASKERWDAWLNDAPEHIKAEAESVFRARTQSDAPMTAAQLAEQNIEKLHKGPRRLVRQ